MESDLSEIYKIRNQTLFPHNITVEDCRAAIKDASGFREVNRENTIVFIYDSISDESFPCPSDEPDPMKSFFLKIRRECRGIIFNKDDGKLLSRKFHKFFNINELKETRAETIDLNQPYILTEKIDGSLIAPILVNDNILWGSKQGASTDLADLIDEFVKNADVNLQYNQFARDWLSRDFTPMFEYSSKLQPIILFYGDDRLRLIGIRNNITGEYVRYDDMKQSANRYNVPMVEIVDVANHPELSTVKTTIDLVQSVKKIRNIEGFVIRLENSGLHYKIKTEWYVDLARLHLNSPKEIKNEKDVWSLILSGHIDDTIAMLSDSIESDDSKPVNQKLKRIKKFSAVLLERIERVSIGIISLLIDAKKGSIAKNKLTIYISERLEKMSPEGELYGCNVKKISSFIFQFFDLITETSTVEQHISFVNKSIHEKCKDSTSNSAKLEAQRLFLGLPLIKY